MSHLVLNRGISSHKNPITNFLRKFSLGPYFLMFSLIAFTTLIIVITLVFSARNVTKGYMLTSLDRENQFLTRRSEEMDMRISQVRSLNSIGNSSQVQKMRRPGKIVYLNGETAIASAGFTK